MKQNFLIFIIALILSPIITWAAEEGNLPELPPAFSTIDEATKESELVTGSDSVASSSSKSIWQKIKSFLGMGGQDENISDSAADSSAANEVKNLAKESDIALPTGDSSQAVESASTNHQEEGSLSETDEVPDQLRLPANFGEEKNDNATNDQDTKNLDEKLDDVPKLEIVTDISKNNNELDNNTPLGKGSADNTNTENAPFNKIESPNVTSATKDINSNSEAIALPPQTQDVDPIKQETPKEDALKPVEVSSEAHVQKANAKESDVSTKNENNNELSKYQQLIEMKKNAPIKIEQISEQDISYADNEDVNQQKAIQEEKAHIDPEATRFASDEAQVLIILNDDVVLGQLTKEAKLEQMDLKSYLNIFWDNYNKLAREPRKLEIEKFIQNYDEMFHKNN